MITTVFFQAWLRIRFAAVCAGVALFVVSAPVGQFFSHDGIHSWTSTVHANPFTQGAGKARPGADSAVSPVTASPAQSVPAGTLGAVSESGAGPDGASETGTTPETGIDAANVAIVAPPTEAGLFAMAYTHVLRRITLIQKDMRAELTLLGRDITTHPGGGSFWLFITFSFGYGVIHALGPGHGKSVVFAYFMGKRGSMFRGFAMGHLLTFVHVLSAVVLVLVLRWVMGISGTQEFDAAGGTMQRISYGLVAAIGVFMTCHAVYELVTGKGAEKACCTAAPQATYKSIFAVSALAGLVPCPGAALVLAFALGLHIPLTGFCSMLALALGMGLTTSLFGVFSILSRSTLIYVAGRGPRSLTVAYSVLSLAGALCITFLGLLMLASVSC